MFKAAKYVWLTGPFLRVVVEVCHYGLIPRPSFNGLGMRLAALIDEQSQSTRLVVALWYLEVGLHPFVIVPRLRLHLSEC